MEPNNKNANSSAHKNNDTIGGEDSTNGARHPAADDFFLSFDPIPFEDIGDTTIMRHEKYVKTREEQQEDDDHSVSSSVILFCSSFSGLSPMKSRPILATRTAEHQNRSVPLFNAAVPMIADGNEMISSSSLLSCSLPSIQQQEVLAGANRTTIDPLVVYRGGTTSSTTTINADHSNRMKHVEDEGAKHDNANTSSNAMEEKYSRKVMSVVPITSSRKRKRNVLALEEDDKGGYIGGGDHGIKEMEHENEKLEQLLLLASKQQKIIQENYCHHDDDDANHYENKTTKGQDEEHGDFYHSSPDLASLSLPLLALPFDETTTPLGGHGYSQHEEHHDEGRGSINMMMSSSDLLLNNKRQDQEDKHQQQQGDCPHHYSTDPSCTMYNAQDNESSGYPLPPPPPLPTCHFPYDHTTLTGTASVHTQGTIQSSIANHSLRDSNYSYYANALFADGVNITMTPTVFSSRGWGAETSGNNKLHKVAKGTELVASQKQYSTADMMEQHSCEQEMGVFSRSGQYTSSNHHHQQQVDQYHSFGIARSQHFYANYNSYCQLPHSYHQHNHRYTAYYQQPQVTINSSSLSQDDSHIASIRQQGGDKWHNGGEYYIGENTASSCIKNQSAWSSFFQGSRPVDTTSNDSEKDIKNNMELCENPLAAHQTTRLVYATDQSLTTNYCFTVMQQVISTTFHEQERKGRRCHIPTEFAGLACRHCNVQAQPSMDIGQKKATKRFSDASIASSTSTSTRTPATTSTKKNKQPSTPSTNSITEAKNLDTTPTSVGVELTSSKSQEEEEEEEDMQGGPCLSFKRTGRYFPRTLKNFCDSKKMMHAIYKHLMKCPKCPEQVKQQLTDFKKQHEEEKKSLQRGSQSRFLKQIWQRLHGGDSM